MGAGVWFQDEARSCLASTMEMSATETLWRGGAQSSLLSRNFLIGVRLPRLAGGHLRLGYPWQLNTSRTREHLASSMLRSSMRCAFSVSVLLAPSDWCRSRRGVVVDVTWEEERSGGKPLNAA